MSGYKVTVRAGAKVKRESYEHPCQALAALERIGRELQSTAGAQAVGGRLMRRMEPVRQVVGRVEVAGPGGLRGGLDVRGDGSTEAFTGRFRRTLVEERRGESSYQALRRELGS